MSDPQAELFNIALDMYMNWASRSDAQISEFAPQLGKVLEEIDPTALTNMLKGLRLGINVSRE